MSPAGKRGGWISAHRRKLELANSAPTTRTPLTPELLRSSWVLDASKVANRLWMGARPPADRPLPMFGTVILCASEYQPIMVPFIGNVIRCPLEDATPTANELAMASAAARAAARAWKDGQRVLVTCYAGLNRSGLVTALMLIQLGKRTPAQIIGAIRGARGSNALSNDDFVAVIEQLARAPAQVRGRTPR